MTAMNLTSFPDFTLSNPYYKAEDLAQLNKQLKRRILLWLIPEILMLGAVVYSLVIRKEWLTSACSAVLVFLVIFSVQMHFMPIKRYIRFIETALNGRIKKTVGVVQSLSNTPDEQDGVFFKRLVVTVGDPADGKDDRLLLFDANLPWPSDWKIGDKLKFLSHEKAILQWEKADENEALEG